MTGRHGGAPRAALLLAAAALLLAAAPAHAQRALIDQARLEAFKAKPMPLQSADGALFVSCVTADRATMRWPVLRFAENVRRELGEAFVPLGSQEAPLLLQLGDATNRVERVERRTLGADDGIAQLVIRMPNPETADLEALRVAVAEALLREKTRETAGSYAAFTWPDWFVRAAVDASRGNVWRAEAYEKVHALLEAGTLPPPDAFFAPDAAPAREVAAFFARWVFDLRPRQADRLALLATPWTRAAILGAAPDEAWPAWVKDHEDTVFIPGALTRAQFRRWAAGLKEPESPEAARAACDALSRQAVGKPAVFRDLTELYLRAYAAAAMGDAEAWRARRAEADEARALLERHLETRPVLQDPPAAPDTPHPKDRP